MGEGERVSERDPSMKGGHPTAPMGFMAQDLPPAAQAAFLRVLQEGEVLPVGGTRPEQLDLRMVAATHRDLDQMVRAGTFRRDLLARLSGVTRCSTRTSLTEKCQDIADGIQ